MSEGLNAHRLFGYHLKLSAELDATAALELDQRIAVAQSHLLIQETIKVDSF